jgi:hypothetical protein
MTKEKSAAQVAGLIADYRKGEIAAPDAAHVLRWIGQFPANVREPVLAEMAHVLARTYARRTAVEGFIEALVMNERIAGADPAAFWKGVRFLRLQQAGFSQRDMLVLFDAALRGKLGFGIDDCGKVAPHTYVYLDDAVFSGGRVKSDLIRWTQQEAPKSAKVAVIVMALHALGEWFAKTDIKKAAAAAGKTIDVTWWRAMMIEDRKAYTNNSDVLRPTMVPAEAAAYAATLGQALVLRGADAVGSRGFFSSGAGRALIEQEFLKAGVRVKQLCPLLPDQMRPLGCTTMRTLGFGSMFVTYRNCANNTPLVLWAGNPWYPLLPRKTN